LGKLHQDLGDKVGDGHVCLIEDDSAHLLVSQLPMRRLKGAKVGGL
jgi:hypothetical protein